ncbi:MAG: PVC-type heme-binding CxxCH protein, partial [Planctomycetota bacterium]|nr:PVC-type heme-binding CxxCH protein [Planctomycetota bacterium]
YDLGMHWSGPQIALLAMLACSPAAAQQGDRAGEDQPPLPESLAIPAAPPLSPQDALSQFSTHDGLRVELVAAEPLVIAPVAMDLAPDGRLWVVEMAGYMTDLAGSEEAKPNGRIVVLDDDDGDGRMDRRTVFVDGLVMPRAVHAVPEGVLLVAPPHLILARDTDGDGRADSQEVLDDTFAGLDNPEHAGNGLRYGMDNWLHCSQHPWEYRFVDGTVQRRAVPTHGQWGTTRDEWDRWYTTPNSYPLFVDLVPKHYANMNPAFRWFDGVYERVPADTGIHPVRINPGVNRGYQPATLRDDFKLASFTGACAPELYLDDTLGPDYRNGLFVCEPTGNCIELRRMIEHGAEAPEARILHDGRSPLASTDERFRPVHLVAGADGALYVADMYRGIIQHRIFMTTFLRNQVVERKLDGPVDRGRIWRLVPDDDDRRSLPDATALAPGDLVALLEDDRGTVRLQAQRAIVESGAATSIEPLQQLSDTSDSPIARAHALWALAGLDALDADRAAAAIESADHRLRTHGLRLAEQLEVGSAPVPTIVDRLRDDAPGVRRQAAASLGVLAPGEHVDVLADVIVLHPDDAVLRSTVIAASPGSEQELLEQLTWDERWDRPSPPALATLRLIARTVLARNDPSDMLGLLELLAAIPPDRDWMTETMAKAVVDHHRLRSDRPRTIELVEAPFDWDARLADAPDVAGGLLGLIDLHTTWPGRPGHEVQLDTSNLPEADVAMVRRGAELYVHCMGCHQANGRGLRRFYPPLAGSELVLGSPDPLIAIILHGMEGPLELDGVRYDQQMPPAPFVSNDDIAAVASYIRTAWGNDASTITPATVQAIRDRTADQRGPWTVQRLRTVFPAE